MGKWLHYPLCAVMIFYLLNTAGQILRLFTDFLIQSYLPETPDWAISALFGVCVAIGVRTGIESIFRFSQLFFWFVLLSGLVGTSILGKGIPTFRAYALLTHFDPVQLWGGAYLSAGNYAELFLVLLLYPQLANGRRTGRTMFWATLSSLVVVLSNLIPTMMLFDTKLAGNMTYPVLEAVRFIRVADFLENLDPLLTAIWIFSLFIKLSLLVCAATLIFSQLVRLKDYRPLSFSLTAFAVGLSFHLGRNFTEVENYIEHAFPTFSLLVASLPCCTWPYGWSGAGSGTRRKPPACPRSKRQAEAFGALSWPYGWRVKQRMPIGSLGLTEPCANTELRKHGRTELRKHGRTFSYDRAASPATDG
ncbi:GerAB/ArcD/ProY family transporter [Paenibacillus sp. CC-CFT747]|nr:GerAB/ArcD/ProY family transporter [Paenibacillus sp. CC-CFT747]